jgi:DNA-binding Lrp family transcriptional regulator
MKKKIQVWSSGYIATGEHGEATFHAEVEAESLDEACEKLSHDPSHAKWLSKANGRWGYYACLIYDNETDARKVYG